MNNDEITVYKIHQVILFINNMRMYHVKFPLKIGKIVLFSDCLN